MIIATEARRIAWSEVPPALRKSYDAALAWCDQFNAVSTYGRWSMLSGIDQVLHNTPEQLRHSTTYFHLAGLRDGLANAQTNVEAILAAHFSNDDDKFIAPIEVDKLIKEHFPDPKAGHR